MANFILSAFADEASNTLDGQIAALKRNGIPLLEPRNIGGGIIDKTDDELKEIRRKLDEVGVGISSLGSPIGKYKIEDDFEPHLNSFFRALRACEILGTDKMRVFSFFVRKDELDKYRPEVMLRMNVMLDEAAKHGVTLCHENESNIYGETPERVSDLLASNPTLYGVFDAANFIMENCSVTDGFSATAARLKYIHIKDMVASAKVNVPVGEGDGKYDEILQAVDKLTEGTVILTLEPHLHFFRAFAQIDSHQFHSAKDFASGDEAFDFAATALKNLLTKLGYKEENNIWKK